MPVPFALAPSDGGPRYDGPGGPLTIPPDQAPDSTRVSGPQGEARLGWGMGSQDRSALEQGIPLEIGGRRFLLVRAGKALQVEEGPGRAVATVRRARGQVVVERAGGGEAARFSPKELSGEVADDATGDEVALLLLVMASNVASVLEKRIPLPFSPFSMLAALA